MGKDDAVLIRVIALVGVADRLIAGATNDDWGWHVDAGGYAGWRAQSLAAIDAILGVGSIYHEEFAKQVTDALSDRVQMGRGILNALHADISNGYLTRYRDLVAGEVFTELLDSASYLLENGYKNAAASIGGAVLENGLRDLLEKNGGAAGVRGNLQSLSTVIFQKQLISALEQKELQAWITLRDHADHGEFDAFDDRDAKRMIDGVTGFLSKHLA